VKVELSFDSAFGLVNPEGKRKS